MVTDKTGVAIGEYVYRPFGETWFEAGTHFRYLYTGQEHDFETGLYFYNARYYDARLARFISADTIVPGAFDPQALNRYSYALNNPLRYTDPTGHETIDVQMTITYTDSSGVQHTGSSAVVSIPIVDSGPIAQPSIVERPPVESAQTDTGITVGNVATGVGEPGLASPLFDPIDFVGPGGLVAGLTIDL